MLLVKWCSFIPQAWARETDLLLQFRHQHIACLPRPNIMTVNFTSTVSKVGATSISCCMSNLKGAKGQINECFSLSSIPDPDASTPGINRPHEETLIYMNAVHPNTSSSTPEGNASCSQVSWEISSLQRVLGLRRGLFLVGRAWKTSPGM